MKVRFLHVAEIELREAHDWYEAQAAGLGEDFLAEIDRVVKRIRQYPHSCAEQSGGTRRALLTRFPYGLWYAIEIDEVVDYAVAHLHREPYYWIHRMVHRQD
ncbi:MAG: type II toxin-antitoxin system RelE/ParE family toxin [Candidatus Hydrogenedentes bacterium]|nr:type II toxin-antitoxin system RelE/ParE family toxin [Candidatus Hydrogenedentota bacterium]